jgi:hypothetical protein
MPIEEEGVPMMLHCVIISLFWFAVAVLRLFDDVQTKFVKFQFEIRRYFILSYIEVICQID